MFPLRCEPHAEAVEILREIVVNGWQPRPPTVPHLTKLGHGDGCNGFSGCTRCRLDAFLRQHPEPV